MFFSKREFLQQDMETMLLLTRETSYFDQF